MTVDVALESMTRLELPPNCEPIVRLYVGDIEHMLVRAPKNRALFLVGPSGAWRLDAAQLLAKFADGVRALERERDLELGIVGARPPYKSKLGKPRKRAA